MAQDYAKRVLTTYKKSKKTKIRWGWLTVFLVLVLVGGYWLFSHKDKLGSKTDLLAFLKLHLHGAKKPAIQSTHPDHLAMGELPIHFDFYNELPNQHVMVSAASETQPVISKPNPPPEQRFYLLFGQYDNASEASQLRVSLLLTDCEADVVEIRTNQGTIFRVQKGPFMSQTEAKKMQALLEKKGVASQINKV